MRKGIFHLFFVYIHIFREQYILEATSGQSWHNYIGPKRETQSLSNQPSLCTFSLKVAWSGISLIVAKFLTFVKFSGKTMEDIGK